MALEVKELGFEDSLLRGNDVDLAADCCCSRFAASERKKLLLLLFFCNVCLYINRANISVAVVYMYDDDGGGKSSKGVVLSAFYWGYVPMSLSLLPQSPEPPAPRRLRTSS